MIAQDLNAAMIALRTIRSTRAVPVLRDDDRLAGKCRSDLIHISFHALWSTRVPGLVILIPFDEVHHGRNVFAGSGLQRVRRVGTEPLRIELLGLFVHLLREVERRRILSTNL